MPGDPTTPETPGRSPANRLEEADPQYALLNEAWMHHLSECSDCNYDRECIGCVVGEDDGPHGCNCTGNGGGYGTRLRRLCVERRDVAQRLLTLADQRAAARERHV